MMMINIREKHEKKDQELKMHHQNPNQSVNYEMWFSWFYKCKCFGNIVIAHGLFVW